MAGAGAHHHELPGLRLPGAPRWQNARGRTLVDADGHEHLDLAMHFGSRLWGHEPLVDVLAPAADAAPGLGDLHAHVLRDCALDALCTSLAGAASTGEDADAWRAMILHTGSESVETGLKTALRATGRPRMAAFERGYHGTFGLALAVTDGATFREPWAEQLPDTVTFTPWGELPELDERTACVVLEPWQGRAGVIPPPDGFHAALRAACDEAGALLVLDAVLCGAGRTGELVTCLDEARPDIVCLGKAIGCGLPASATLVRADVAARAWDRGDKEAPHTSTMLGEPVACAGILAALERLDARADELAAACAAWTSSMDELPTHLAPHGAHVRGRGLAWTVDTRRPGGGMQLASDLLEQARLVTVPSGAGASGITLLPAATTTLAERERALAAIVAALTRRA